MMKGLLLIASLMLLAITPAISSAFTPAPLLQMEQVEDNFEPLLNEVAQTLAHYRAWLESPAILNVVKGTNHAARATVLIDAHLQEYARDMPIEGNVERRVGLRGIRSLLLKQMRIHVDMLSTTVPAGIVVYDSEVENALEEQLNLLQETMKEFERHQSKG